MYYYEDGYNRKYDMYYDRIGISGGINDKCL